VLRIDPDPGIDLVVQAKQPGADTTRTVDLSLVFAEELGEAPLPYERLLGDAVAATPACSPGKTAWRRRGASCNRCWTRRLR
jgi:glucose-6-phosphate 1-dehydrogenase